MTEPNVPLDRELLERFRAGDAAVFDQLARRITPRLTRVAGRLAPAGIEAADLVQEALVRLYRSPPALTSETSIHSWLYRVVYNLSRDADRRERRHLEALPLERLTGASAAIEPTGPRQVERSERRRRIDRAMTGLPDWAREVLTLRYDAELDYTEIAELLDCSVGTVGSRLHRALLRLGELLTGNSLREDRS